VIAIGLPVGQQDRAQTALQFTKFHLAVIMGSAPGIKNSSQEVSRSPDTVAVVAALK
jgi:hypothetical protein